VEAVTGKLLAFLPKRNEEEFTRPLITTIYDGPIYDNPIYDRRLAGRDNRATEAAGDPVPEPSADATNRLGPTDPRKPAAASAAAGAFTSMPGIGSPATASPSKSDWRPDPGRLPESPKPPLSRLGQELRDVGYRLQAGRPAPAEASSLPVVVQTQALGSEPFPWLWAAALFVATSAAVFAFLLLGGLQSDGRLGQAFASGFRASDLNLNVATDHDHLRLTWNQRNPAVASALDGTLQIFDGTDHREVRMDPRQLADGLVLYRPLTNDVTFRLEVRGRQGGTTGSVRVLDGLGSGQGLALSEPGPDSSGQLWRQAPQGGGATSSEGVPDPGSPPLIRPNTTVSAGPLITDTPVIKAARPVLPTVARRSETSQVFAAQPDSPASTINGWDTSGSKSGAKPRTSLPVAKAEPAGAGFVGPRPLIQVMPRTSAIPASAIETRTRVEVQVHIDPAGKVATARVLGSGVNQSIAAAAFAAARQWTFVPASSNGQHVESDHTIVFEFRPRR
jgi:TonB family protein